MFASEHMHMYTRDELRQKFGIQDATLNTGFFVPAGYQSIWLFVTEQKTKDSLHSSNVFIDDRLHWDGSMHGRGDKFIIEHEVNGYEILVFYRQSRSSFRQYSFKYEGRFRYVSHTGTRPTHFILQRVDRVTATIDKETETQAERTYKETVFLSQLDTKNAYSLQREEVLLPDEHIKHLNIFFCYAHKDKILRDELEMHLTGLGNQYRFISWYDQEISPGREWAKEIDAQLTAADIILLLVSPHFMASNYCYEIEMKRAMQRHEQGKARVIPIILYPVYWQGTPFNKLQALPTGAVPVTDRKWRNHEQAFFDVVEGIRKVIKEIIDA